MLSSLDTVLKEEGANNRRVGETTSNSHTRKMQRFVRELTGNSTFSICEFVRTAQCSTKWASFAQKALNNLYGRL